MFVESWHNMNIQKLIVALENGICGLWFILKNCLCAIEGEAHSSGKDCKEIFRENRKIASCVCLPDVMKCFL